ncbi:MAG: type II toxin-antitoxin system Phd/YefM family antitoxin [Kiritimatiellae bacterium]|nr:type II toxin-antitoxin system Phd/YefM family antitoxin [Kiritimatiellia bacterium]
MPLPAPINLEHDVVPFTAFRASLAAYIEQTRRTHRPILVTQNGKSAAVLLSPADFDQAAETLALMADVRAAEAELDRGEALTPAEVEASLRTLRHSPPTPPSS